MFCKATGKRVAVYWQDVGGLVLDVNMGKYNICEITNEKGGQRHFASYARYTKREMCDLLYFATEVIYEKERITKTGVKI